MMRRVETFGAHQKLAGEALVIANKENVYLKDQVGKLNFRVSGLTEEVEMVRKEVESAGSEAEKHYVANFHLIEEYQSFAKYWRR